MKIEYPVIINIELFDELSGFGHLWISEYRVILASNLNELYEKISRYVEKKYPKCMDYTVECYRGNDKYEI